MVAFTETESKMVVARGWKWQNEELLFNDYGISVCKTKNSGD
jgi:hypothetical protein